MNLSRFARLVAVTLLLCACEASPEPPAGGTDVSSDAGTLSDAKGEDAVDVSAGEVAAQDAPPGDVQPTDTAQTDAAPTDTTLADTTLGDTTLGDTTLADTQVTDTQAADSAGEDSLADTATSPWDCLMDFSDSMPASYPWTLFKLVKGAGPCPPGQICQWTWTVTTDHKVAKSMAGVESVATMSDADFGLLSKMLGSPIFGAQMQKGFTCGPPPTDIYMGFELSLSGVQYTQPVTGCLFGGQACSDAKAVADIVTSY